MDDLRGVAMLFAPPTSSVAGADAKPNIVSKITTGGGAYDIRFSPDGKTLAILFIDDDGSHMMLWDVETRKPRDTIKNIATSCMDFAFTFDGKGMIYLDNTRVHFLDLKTRKSRELYRHSKEADAVAVNGDGKLLATGGSDEQIIVWDCAAGKEVMKLQCPGIIGNKGLRFFPDSKRLVANGSRAVRKGNHTTIFREIWFFDLEKKALMRTQNDASMPSAMAVSPDGKTLATQDLEKKVGEVWLWDTATDKVRNKYQTKAGHIFAIEYSPDGKVLFGGGGQPDSPLEGGIFDWRIPGAVTAWDAATGKELASFKVLKDNVIYMAISPDGKLLAASHGGYSSSLDYIEVWDVSSLYPQPKK